MCAPAPPSWHAHLVHLGFKALVSLGQGLPFGKILYGTAALRAISACKALRQEKHPGAMKNCFRAPLEYEERVKDVLGMSLWTNYLRDLKM